MSTPEFLESGPPAPRVRNRNKLVVFGAAGALVAGGVTAGVWGVGALLGGGAMPDSVLPANTLAYVAVDLDPSAGQKIQALKALRKFPDSTTKLGSRDDLREWIFGLVTGRCLGGDYEQDVKPWLGHRAAFAAVAADKSVTALAVLQVTDKAKAEKGLTRCLRHPDLDTALVGEYLLVTTDGDADADAIADEAKAAPLAEDAAYRTWIERAGEPGILSAYVAKGGPKTFFTAMYTDMTQTFEYPEGDVVEGEWSDDQLPPDVAVEYQKLSDKKLRKMGLRRNDKGEIRTGPPPAFEEIPGGHPDEDLDDYVDALTAPYDDFEGAALSVRFDDDGLEANLVSKGFPVSGGAFIPVPIGLGRAPASLGDLPGDTAAAIGLGLRPGWVESYFRGFDAMFGGFGPSVTEQLSKQLGLVVPEELETVLGAAATIALGPDVPGDLLERDNPGELADVPTGLRITGDPAKIVPLAQKVVAASGKDADGVVITPGDGVVTVSFSPSYAEKLLVTGKLGDSERFRSVMPDADQAEAGFYVDLDVGELAEFVAQFVEVSADDVRPLSALGLTDHTDEDGFVHDRLRVTFD